MSHPGRDHDDRVAQVALPEPVDQLDPVHSGQMEVDHETPAPGEVRIGQEFGAARVGTNGQSLQLEHELEGASHRQVIVHEEDGSGMLGNGPPCPFQRMRDDIRCRSNHADGAPDDPFQYCP
jgi:hypothetical protein